MLPRCEKTDETLPNHLVCLTHILVEVAYTTLWSWHLRHLRPYGFGRLRHLRPYGFGRLNYVKLLLFPHPLLFLIHSTYPFLGKL